MKKYGLLALFLVATVAVAATTYTTNYDLAKPGDGDANYGELLRDNFDTIDTQLKVNADSVGDHVNDAAAAHAATAVSTTPGDFICASSTTVQHFLDCLDGVFDPGVSGVMLLAGDQTVTGSKTFTATTEFSGDVELSTILAAPVLGTSAGGVIEATSFDALDPLTTKGDLLTFNTVSTNLGVGTDGQFLQADSSTPEGITWYTLVKADIGLGDVDNTSDAAKDAAATTLTNKTISGAANTITNLDLTTAVTGILPAANGGTGVANNAAETITLSGDDPITFTTTNTTGVTLPTTGTLATLAGTETLTGKTLTGNIAVTLVSGAATVTLPTNTGTLATLANAETLTNKTLTSPVINTPTGIVKGDVGLGNVDNTSDATKNAAAVTLTNKTIASPTVTGALLLQNAAGSQPEVLFSEDPDNGTNAVAVKAAASIADFTLTLPPDDGDSGEVLSTNGSGVLDWIAPLVNPMDSEGDLIYGGAAGAATKLDSGSSGQILISGGAAVPVWTTLLPLANGGTNKATTAAAGALAYSDADSYELSAVGTASMWALSGGTGAPTFSNTTTLGKVIDVATDSAPLTITGHSTQTSDLLTVEADGGADSLIVNGDDDATGANVVIRGTATNDNAGVGFVGEFVEATSAVSNISGNPIDMTSITLGPGDWDMQGFAAFNFNSTSNATDAIFSLSKTPGTHAAFAAAPSDGEVRVQYIVGSSGNFNDMTLVTPVVRVTVATATTKTYYAVSTGTWTTSTLGTRGYISARRVR